MRRANRLQDLIQILRDGEIHRAQDLAVALRVSERTIWRDMDVLAASGVPVAGARGRGYRLNSTLLLPPQSLTETELEALRLGLAVVAEGADDELQAAARGLAARVEAALPGHPVPAGTWTLAVAPFAGAMQGLAHMPLIRRAIRDGERLEMRLRADESAAPAVLRPLALDYGGDSWTLTAWSDTGGDFWVGRVDGIARMRLAGSGFAPEPGKTLADFLARFEAGPDGN